MKLIDLTQIIENDMPVYPGDNQVTLIQDKYYEKDKYSNFILHAGMHIGTHIDSPMHMTNSNKTIEEYPLDHFYGNGILINALGKSKIEVENVSKYNIQKGDIVLFYTGFDKYYQTKKYYENHPILTEETVQYLIEKQVKLIGIDCPSPDYFPYLMHKLLLNNEIFIIENLCQLEKLTHFDHFEIIAFPLKMKADASFLRVVAKINNENI